MTFGFILSNQVFDLADVFRVLVFEGFLGVYPAVVDEVIDVAIEAPSRLSHIVGDPGFWEVARLTGFEPATPGSEAQCSIR